MITFKKFTLVGFASVFLSGSIQAADTPTLKYGGRLQKDYTDFHTIPTNTQMAANSVAGVCLCAAI